MDKINILGYFMFFCLGIVSCYLVISINDYNGGMANTINFSQIKAKDNTITFLSYEKPLFLFRVADTGSMHPCITGNSTAINIIPENESEINIGDIVSFDDGKDLVVHRVIKIGKDKKGIYFITKGDNVLWHTEKIRFKDIKYKKIAVIY